MPIIGVLLKPCRILFLAFYYSFSPNKYDKNAILKLDTESLSNLVSLKGVVDKNSIVLLSRGRADNSRVERTLVQFRGETIFYQILDGCRRKTFISSLSIPCLLHVMISAPNDMFDFKRTAKKSDGWTLNNTDCD